MYTTIFTGWILLLFFFCISCCDTEHIFNNTFPMNIWIVIINYIITAGCPITFQAYCAMSSGYTVYSSGCKRSNYSAVIWCNEIKIAIMKKAEAAQYKGMEAFFTFHLMPNGLFTYDPSKSSNHYGWPLHPLLLYNHIFFVEKTKKH